MYRRRLIGHDFGVNCRCPKKRVTDVGSESGRRSARRGCRSEALVVSEQILSFKMEIADRFLIVEKGEFVYQAERKNVDTTKIHLYLTI